MNINLRIAIASGVSFIAGYFVANFRNEKFYFERANEEVEAAREEYEAKLTEAREQARESNDQVDEKIREASLVAKASEALSSYQGNGGFMPVDVHAVAEKIPYSSYNTEEAEKQQPREVEQPENIELINSEQFANSEYDYEQPTYEYYRGQDILTGSHIGEGKVDEDLRKMLLGSRADLLAREGFWEGLGDDAFYLRNHDLKIDVEIILADDDLKYEDPAESAGGNG